MRFVAVKGVGQQSILVEHRTRELLVRQRTMVINAMRAHMAELGIVAPVGRCPVGDPSCQTARHITDAMAYLDHRPQADQGGCGGAGQ